MIFAPISVTLFLSRFFFDISYVRIKMFIHINSIILIHKHFNRSTHHLPFVMAINE